MWKELRDLNDLLKEEPYREEVRVEEIDRIKKKRYKKEMYRKIIHAYLRKYHKPIGMLSKEDIAIMTQSMDAMDRTLFMDQVKYSLETTYWKPLARIIKNNKSILFTNNK